MICSRFIVVVAFVATSACSSVQTQTEPPIDRAKFEALYRAGKAVQAGIGSDVLVLQFNQTLAALQAEVLIAKDKATQPKERAMVAAYADALREVQAGFRAQNANALGIGLAKFALADRLYLSDERGALETQEQISKAQAALAKERAASARAFVEQRDAAAARQAAERAQASRVEAIAPRFSSSDPQVRAATCRELAAMGTAASMYNANIRELSEHDSDPSVRAACGALWEAIAPALR